MVKREKVHVFDVTVGERMPERFMTLGAAKKRAKELKKEGYKVRIYTSFVNKSSLPTKTKRKMGFWKGSVPWTISPEAAALLVRSWQYYSETIYLGAYRHFEPCRPDDRDGDLTLQHGPGGFCLCYHDIPSKRTYIILDELDRVNVSERTVEFSGKDADGLGMTVTMQIAGAGKKKMLRASPFPRGWYRGDGFAICIDEENEKRLKDFDSNEIAAVYPFLAVYPDPLGKDGYVAGMGELVFKDGERLEDLAWHRLGTWLAYVGKHPDLERAFKDGDARSVRYWIKKEHLEDLFEGIIN